MKEKYIFGYVSVVGKPNAGKSSLVNALVGEKVAIVSPKRQTTRNNILGIKTDETSQIVFVDTPGIHQTRHHLDKYMMKNVRSAISGCDLIIYLLDGTKDEDKEEQEYVDKLKIGDIPVIVAYTKKDLKKRENFQISSVTGENLNDLVKMIKDALPKFDEKNFEFEEDEYTNKSMRFMVSECVREKALKFLGEEIPHGIAVEIISFVEEANIYKIEVDIICEKQSHKGMVIGKQGLMLKKIATAARTEMEELFGKKVFIKTYVKVKANWRDNLNILNDIGYND